MVRALVVVADTATAERYVDMIASLDNECDLADSQCAARKLLEANRYTYVLLELNIAARSGCPHTRLQTGLNLLEQIRSGPATSALPVIATVLTGEPNLAVAAEAVKLGVSDLICPPLVCAVRTIDHAIKRLLRSSPHQPASESTLNVKGAGALLMDVVDGLTLKNAMARVSKAAKDGRLRTNGEEGRRRRICRDSLSTWLLEQRNHSLQQA